MRELGIALFVTAAVATSGCGPAAGEGTVESCAGVYTGTYECADASCSMDLLKGRITGLLPSKLDEMGRGDLRVTFVSDDVQDDMGMAKELGAEPNPISAVDRTGIHAAVTSTGGIQRGSGGVQLVGVMDLDTCEVSGEWRRGAFFRGTWKAERFY